MKFLLSSVAIAAVLSSCNNPQNQENQVLAAKQATIDSMKIVLAKKAVVDSMNNVMAEREQTLADTQIIRETRVEKGSQVVVNNNIPANQTPQKKKWNHTAKGAVVGAGTGAITGAIVNKNRLEGAVIGSVIGAGVGAGTGAIVDAQKKKKEKNN